MKNGKTLKTIILLTAILAVSTNTFSQTPCTNADANQKVGIWSKQGQDSLANADPSFPKEQYKPVLAKAQKVIELLKQANPQPIGIQASAYRNISGRSATPNGALLFGVRVLYYNYLCRPDTPGDSERGQIFANGETTTVVRVYFNSLGSVANIEKSSLGKEFTTANNEIIFLSPQQTGKLKGLSLLFLTDLDSCCRDEAVVITADNRSAFKPVTREQFLQALEKNSRKKIKKLQGNLQQSAIEEGKIARIESIMARMSSTERQIQAVIVDQSDSPETLFVPESQEGSSRLVTIDQSLFNPGLSRETIQFITVHWSLTLKSPAKAELIRQFKQNFDFEALKQMLGK